ncbi:sigma-70 family RNA polymerase sigma factor [Mucilaginibacter sp. ZT4R22]|uniref:Sigma-70 family RNA polymerase sigma factor n=1 Tax=Mucilaginibacter pankratovii TaxID=2772110 RepID=A0ABR7WK18_9SPHI|nr:sigma-70 family RNA polymerase sigma factor [Mucilaginibacter pankratovii]MBD1362669.1 sigma-70 family RNA polymerase sigma factor [Mucilaginibacter pankratovii]
MPSNNVTDSELFEAIILDNEKAFNQLFERHWFKVYSVANKYVKDEEIALEIAHDIFLNIWNKRHQLKINSFKNYVTTAASYHGIRKKQTLAGLILQYVEDYNYVENEIHHYAGNQGEMALVEKDVTETVDALLKTLPKRCREIYHMSRRDNLSITEISEKLGISKRTVENQLTTALKHLRTSFKYSIILMIIGNL